MIGTCGKSLCICYLNISELYQTHFDSYKEQFYRRDSSKELLTICNLWFKETELPKLSLTSQAVLGSHPFLPASVPSSLPVKPNPFLSFKRLYLFILRI